MVLRESVYVSFCVDSFFFSWFLLFPYSVKFSFVLGITGTTCYGWLAYSQGI